MKIVLTNDDGFGEPGLEALINFFSVEHEVVVVAPKEPQSGIGHRVTTHDPITVREIDSNRFSVAGTPADCTRIALKSLAPDAEWIVAGINPGANLGSDVYNSGTVAAAREAAILGCRAISISQYIAKNHIINWKITAQHAGRVLGHLIHRQPPSGHFWNVNLPHPLKIDDHLKYAYCNLDLKPHKYEYRVSNGAYLYQGVIHDRNFEPDSDVAHCFSGKVAITCISLQTGCLDESLM